MLGEHNYCSYEIGRLEEGRRIHSKDASIGMVVAPDACADLKPRLGFRIESSLELASIQRNCPHLWLSQDFDPDLLDSDYSGKPPANCDDLIDAIRAELPAAERVFSQALIEIRSIYNGLRSGLIIELDLLKHIVAEIIASSQRCPNALLLLAQCKNDVDYLYEHAVRVAIYSVALGHRSGMKQDDLRELGLGAMLHDVGKIMIPNNILDKVGELNSAEYAVVQVHPLEGRKILINQARVPESVVDVVIQHHERMDGNGYPAGLPGHQISPFARIVAIMDAFDAMSSDRCYCRSRPTSEALEILQRCKGAQFDSNLVDMFCGMIGDLPVGHFAVLSNGEQGIILGTDLNNRLYHSVVSIGENESATPSVQRVFAWPVASLDEVYVKRIMSASEAGFKLCELIERFADLK